MVSTELWPPVEYQLNLNVCLLTKWKKLHAPILGRLSMLKAYAISKLSFHMFLDPLKESDCKMLNSLTMWFLWSSDDVFSETKTYHTKMSMERVTLPKNKDGLGLWNWSNRSKAFLAKTNAWMDKTISPQIHEIWITSTSSLTSSAKRSLELFFLLSSQSEK